MEPVDDPFESSPSRDHEAALSLLEDYWFFENSLKRRTRMLRCFSDPSPSSSVGQDVLAGSSCGQTSSSLKQRQQPEDDGLPLRNLARVPSLPPCIGGEEDGIQGKQGLRRTPSLPPCRRREEVIQGKDRRENSNWQLFPNFPDSLPPRYTAKGMTPSFNIPRHRPPRKPVGIMNMDSSHEPRHRCRDRRKIRRSLSDLECEELQGFKDLGFSFDKEDLNPSVINIIPGLQERIGDDSDEESVRRPYLSEVWHEHSSAPALPNWGAKESAENMKAHIKCWARAVAFNVRQEC